MRCGGVDTSALFADELLATFLSAPFNRTFTRLVGQQVQRYAGPRTVVSEVLREEGPGRLLAGSDYRLAAFLLPVLVEKSLFAFLN